MEPTWQTDDGRVRLWHADCREVLPTLMADSVVTDPPYGVGYEYDSYDDSRDAYAAIIECVTGQCRRIASRGVAVAVPFKNAMMWPQPDWMICWRKTFSVSRSPFGSGNFEINLYYGKGCLSDRQSDAFEATYVSDEYAKDHPCPKPIGWAKGLLSICTKADEVVLDPYMGSGTTGVACIRTGRKFLGIEKDERYFNIAVKRIKDELARTPLFDAAEVQAELFDNGALDG